MPQLLLVALAAAGAWYAYRWLRRETERVDKRLRHAEVRIMKRRRKSRETINLRLDPSTGIYLPAAE
jgi:hypothetical protein